MHRYLFETGDMAPRLYGNVAIGMFMNVNDYVTFVATALPFSLYKFFNVSNLVKKLYYSLISIISLFLLIRSESRTVLLVFVAFTGILVYLFCKNSLRNKIIVFLAFSLIAYILHYSNQLLQSVYDYLLVFMVDSAEHSNLIRINLIKNGLYFLEETYGFGVGAGNLYDWLGEKSIYFIGGVRFIHNWYVEILATFGVILFIFYIIFHTKILLILFKERNNKKIWEKHNIIFISFVIFSITSISSSSNVFSEWVWMYLVFVSTYCLYLNSRIRNYVKAC